jgi:hypothetical protein
LLPTISLSSGVEKAVRGAIATLIVLALCYGLYQVGHWLGKREGKFECASAQKIIEVQERIITKTVTVQDEAEIKRLKARNAELANAHANLVRSIDNDAKAHPQPSICRLPDGLRDDLNGAIRNVNSGNPPDSARSVHGVIKGTDDR